MSFILKSNFVVLLFWSVLLYFRLQHDAMTSALALIELFTFAGLILLQVFFSIRHHSVYGFSMVMLYTLALANGMKIMLSFDVFFTGFGFFSLFGSGLLIVFLVGVRGYLQSEKGRQQFNLIQE